MAIFRKGKELLVLKHEGKIIKQIYHLGKKYIMGWLSSATKQAIEAAFGAECIEVINATNYYINAIANTDLQRAQ